jgi:hypothetical protein
MKTKIKAQNPEKNARDQRFEIFEEVLRLVPSNPSKRKCTGYRDHLEFYKSYGAEVQFDSGYHKNELPENYRYIWLPLEIDPYQGGTSTGTGPTYPRLSCHKSSNVNLEWLIALAAEWALQGNCYEEVE